MSAMPWLAGEHATFEEALETGREVRAAAVEAGGRLPQKDLSRLYPSTMQDAVSVVHARLEDSKKKAAQSKQKSKSKSGVLHLPSDSHFPGARAGGGDPSAFWMYIEDYFRDFTQEDLRGLLPLLLDPRDDPALRVPPSGRLMEDEKEQQRRHAAAKAAAEAARAAAVAASMRGGSEWDSGAVDSRPSGGLDSSPEAERRSSRLVSRQCKEEEQRRQEVLEAQAAAAATVAEQAEAAAATAAARSMSVTPTTASGAPAKQLLDVLPEQRLAMLLQQLTELMQLVGVEALSPGSSASVQASLATLQAAASSNGSTSELDEGRRAELQDWLQQQLAPLAEKLGCSFKVLPPWAQQLAARSKDAAAGKDTGAAASKGAAAGKNKGAAATPAAATAAAKDGKQQQDERGGKGGKGTTMGLAADLPAAKLATAAYIHPYTELMLLHPVQRHTMQQAVDVPAPEVLISSRQVTAGQEEAAAAAAAVAGAEDGTAADGDEAGGAAGAAPEVATPAASLLTATPGSAALLSEVLLLADMPSLSEQQTQGTTAADLAAAGADTAATADAVGSPMAVDGLVQDAAAGGTAIPLDCAAVGDEAQQGTGSTAGGVGSGSTLLSRAGGRARGVSNYALLAGKKSSNRSNMGPPKKAVRPATVRHEEVGPLHPVARAVAALVAAGQPDGPAAEQCKGGVGYCSQLLAVAPEDEVLAEMLALQNELMQQAAINRMRLVPALAGVLGEVEERRAAAAQRAREEEEVKIWILKVREIKRQQHRQRREQAHLESLAAKKQSIMASPRPVLGRQRGSYELEEGEEGREGSPALQYALRPWERYDVMAQRKPNDEAVCAVCIEGDSAPPNEIVFCERCDMAVHQYCYGIPVVPEGEWLCEPCNEYEEMLRAQGALLAAIRPPSWHTNRVPLEGGARSVKCALCPIKNGAFKRAEDGRRWVHSACALWIPETYIAFRDVPGTGRQEFVGGLDKIKADRWHERCSACGLIDGGVMACQQPGGCSKSFHVLCARNIGLHLPVRPDPSRKSALQYRLYCADHSDAQRVRDEKLKNERLEKAAVAQQKESKARAAERAAAAKQALVAAEGERQSMFYLRANLETTRMLTDVTKRRERLKKQLVVLQYQQWQQLQQIHPQEALAWLQDIQRRRQEQVAAAVAMAAAAAAAAQQQQQACVCGPGPALMAAPTQRPPLDQLQQLPSFALPLPPQQQQQQQPQPPMPGPAALGGLQLPGGLPFMPSPQMQMQMQMPPPPQMLVPQAQAPPAFALDMFAPQHPHHFFMHHQQQQQPGGGAAVIMAGAPAFPGLPMQLPLQQQSMIPSGGHELPATAAGMLVSLPRGAAAAAQVPADVATVMFGAPHPTAAPLPDLVPGMPIHLVQQQHQLVQHQQLAGMDPAVVAVLQAQPSLLRVVPMGHVDLGPSPRHPHAAAAAAATAAAAGTPGSVSPQLSAGGSGSAVRPKRASAAGFNSGGSKRQRSGSEEVPPEPAAAPVAMMPPPPAAFAPLSAPSPAPDAPAAAGGVAAGAGRRQRVASVKIRESMIQRERFMNAEEAEKLNSQLPVPLRYLPAEDLEARLGSPSARARAAAAGSGSNHQGQPKPRSKAGGQGGGSK